MRLTWIAVGLVGIALSGCVSEYSLSPLPGPSQQIRYEQGAPTIYSEQRSGAIQVTPIRVTDDMRLAFGIAAFNKAPAPSNFGSENVSLAEADGTAGKIFTSDELIHQAKVNAQWAEFATALAGGLAASTAYSTTHASIRTPYGRASYTARSYDPVAAAEIHAETRENMDAIQASLDSTVGSIHETALQTTTVNPGDSYGGYVVAEKLSSSHYPQQVALHVTWNGEDHLFQFIVAEGPPTVPKGAIAPAPTPAAAPSSAPPPPVIEAKLPYGYSDHSQAAETAAPPAPQFVSFDQWQKANTGKKSAP